MGHSHSICLPHFDTAHLFFFDLRLQRDLWRTPIAVPSSSFLHPFLIRTYRTPRLPRKDTLSFWCALFFLTSFLARRSLLPLRVNFFEKDQNPPSRSFATLPPFFPAGQGPSSTLFPPLHNFLLLREASVFSVEGLPLFFFFPLWFAFLDFHPDQSDRFRSLFSGVASPPMETFSPDSLSLASVFPAL